MDRITSLISLSSRPLVWAGHGIRLAGEAKRFREFIDRTGLLCVTTWTGADLLPTDHLMNCGIVGVSGQRGANKAVHDADLLLVLGSHLSIPQTSALTESFAPNAVKIVVDIDQDQLENMTVKVDLPICAHLREFFDADLQIPQRTVVEINGGYRHLNEPPAIGSYAFNAAMTRLLPPGTIMVVDGGGTALYTGFQSSYIKEGSRLICSSSMSAMGSGLPEAIGACLANGHKLTTCLIGDGSLMLNVQELQTIATHKLPIKIFVINNGGYLAIRQTQKAFQEGRYYGVGGDDLQFPNLVSLANAFGITYSMSDRLETLLDWDGPVLCEVRCPPDQPMLRQGFRDGKPLPLTEMVLE